MANRPSYPRFKELIPEGENSSGKYLTKFASTPQELDQILRLRFEIFNEELGEGLESSVETGRDEDDFDANCHHLMVIQRESNQVVGTYRMQTREMAQSGIGFYSAGEFDLSGFPENVLSRCIEVGRACIAQEHRNGRVLFLLWRGLMKYLLTNKKVYLFGCCSLTTQDPEEGIALLEYLKEKDHLHPRINLPPQPGFECELPTEHISTFPSVKIPRLMRIYLNYGGKICSGPAIDRQFKTIDYICLLNIEDFDKKTFEMFAASG